MRAGRGLGGGSTAGRDPLTHPSSAPAGSRSPVPVPVPVPQGTVSGSAPTRWIAAASAALLGFLLVLAVVVTTKGVDTPDTAVMHAVVHVRTPSVTLAARAITTLGSTPVVVALAVLAAALLWRRTGGLVMPFVLVTAVTVTGATVYLSKIAVGRARPSAAALLGPPARDYSFPSGHTTEGAVVWVLTALLLGATTGSAARRLLVLTAVLLAAAIGLTRIYLGYHWSTDVVGGWLLAAAVVLTATGLERRLVEPGQPELFDRRAATVGPTRSGRRR